MALSGRIHTALKLKWSDEWQLRRIMNAAGRALIAGSLGAIGSAVVLGLCARREGRAAPQPLNATAHWLHGDSSSLQTTQDLTHTGVGFVTHHAASMMWAVLFDMMRRRTDRDDARAVLKDALATATIAAVVDYGLTPHRFTPGWELVLSKKSMAAAYLGMVAGFAGSEFLLPRRSRSQHRTGGESRVRSG
jgi:hypothetical protein